MLRQILKGIVLIAAAAAFADVAFAQKNDYQPHVGQQVQVQVQSLLQTGAGVIVFADTRQMAVA